MADIDPCAPGDPPRVGEYELTGRVGEGCPSDGRRLLLTTFDESSGVRKPVGFAIVDVSTARATLVKADTQEADAAPFMWAPGETSVAQRYGSRTQAGLRFFDLRGKTVHRPQRENPPPFTPPTNARHSPGAQTSTGPCGFLESRTATAPGRPVATSTHSPPSPPDRLDLRQRATLRSISASPLPR